MPFDSPAHRDRLRMLATYVASSSFTNSSGWALAKTGHMLVEKPSGQETLAIGVAKVLDYKLFCGPTGNYNEKFKGTTPLEKAKYTFTVGRPDEMAFHEDYDKLFSNLEKVQSSISFGNDRRNMLDASTRTIRFSGLVFHERPAAIDPPVNVSLTPDGNNTRKIDLFKDDTQEQHFIKDTDDASPHPPIEDSEEEHAIQKDLLSEQQGAPQQQGSNAKNVRIDADTNAEDCHDDQLDEETELWPVPIDVVDDMNRIKYTHRAAPLPVYKDDQFVEPLQVNSALKNALVEVHFGVLHYRIGKPGNTFESFTASPQQVIILKTAPIQTPSVYKRKNIRSGPVRPKKFGDFSAGL